MITPTPKPSLEPFIVDAKVLRPDTQRQKIVNHTANRVSLVLAVEVFAMTAFTIASLPLIAAGLAFGLVYMIFLVGFLFLLPTAGGIIGLYGVWSLLLRSDKTLVENQRLRKQAVRCVQIGIVTAVLLSPWIVPALTEGPAAISHNVPLIVFVWMVPVIVGVHRVWRLRQMMRALGIDEDFRAMTLASRLALALGLTLERCGKPDHPVRHAKWGARL